METPANLKRLRSVAERAGWECSIAEGHGVLQPSRHRAGRPVSYEVDSMSLRMHRGDMRLSAIWCGDAGRPMRYWSGSGASRHLDVNWRCGLTLAQITEQVAFCMTTVELPIDARPRKAAQAD